MAFPVDDGLFTSYVILLAIHVALNSNNCYLIFASFLQTEMIRNLQVNFKCRHGCLNMIADVVQQLHI